MVDAAPSRGALYRRCSLAELVTVQARQSPERIALRSTTASLTYGEFDRRADQLAAWLKAQGVRPGHYVGVHMHHTVEALVALLGVLKAGAAYMPTDPETPAERLGVMLRDAAVKVVLTDPRALASLKAFPVSPLVLEPGLKQLDAWEPAPPAEVFPESIAYAVYTSGSTGEPKGVFVPHRGIVNLCQAVVETWKLRPEDRVHLFGPLNFDAVGETIFSTLAAGATLVFRGETVPAPQEYTREILEKGLTVLTLPPIYLHQWLTELVKRGERLPGSVRMVSLGGDKISLETRRLWREVGGQGIPWVNDYGPTEATVTATQHVCGDEPGEPGVEVFPIGKAVPNVRVYLLDAGLRPVEKGQTGELYIAGVGVSHGYLNRPAETAERFIPDPWSPEPGARMYRTGDLAREQADGTLLFLGRADDQVKIRGNRVELREVELTLQRHPGVREAAVAARPGLNEELRLVAYWVAQAEAPTDASLQAFLRERLPDFMVPSAWMRLDALPLTTSGKVDRRALPTPPPPAAAEPPAEAAQGESAEQVIVRLCSQLIGKPVEPGENFFDAGGDSLQAMQLISMLEDHFKVVVPLQAVFQAMVIADIAVEVNNVLAESNVDAMSSEQVDELLRKMQKTGS